MSPVHWVEYVWWASSTPPYANALLNVKISPLNFLFVVQTAGPMITNVFWTTPLACGEILSLS